MRLRKDVNVYLYNPAKRYFHIVIEMDNVPGALNNVLELMGKFRINVLGSFSSVDGSAKLGVWSGFVEDSDHTAAQLRSGLAASPHVHDAMVVESNKGFLVDGVHFPLTFNTGDRAVMLDSKAVARMLANVMEEFGSGGSVILYEEGKSYGKEVASEYARTLGGEFISANLAEVLKLYQALGWFRVESAVVDPIREVITVQAAENFECEAPRAGPAHSHFVRGHLEGMISVWLGEELESKETECSASGAKFCEFEFRPRA